MAHSLLAAMFTEYRKYGKQNSMFVLQMFIWELTRRLKLNLKR